MDQSSIYLIFFSHIVHLIRILGDFSKFVIKLYWIFCLGNHGSSGKESACNARDIGDMGSIPELERSPGGGKWQPIPVFLPEKSHGLKSLVGYIPKGSRVGHDWATKHNHIIPEGSFFLSDYSF